MRCNLQGNPEWYGDPVELRPGFTLYPLRHPAADPVSVQYEIYGPGGDKVGWIVGYNEGGVVGIDKIFLEPPARGQGLGRLAVKVIRDQHGPVGSDPAGVTSPEAVKMWQSLGAVKKPANNTKGFRWVLEGVSYSSKPDNPAWSNPGAMIFLAQDDAGNKIGQLNAAPSLSEPGTIYVTGVKVEQEHRRKGIATELYKMAQAHFKMPFGNESYKTPDGSALRNALAAMKVVEALIGDRKTRSR